MAMNQLLSRFLDYVSFDTQSDEHTGTHPSTAKQRILAEHLAAEMVRIGLDNVRVSEYGYVYGVLPATAGLENAMPFGLIAHLDTAAEASGANVRPQVVTNWDGTPITLGESKLVLTPAERFKGTTLITTDGTTLLGADDKAGIAIIMTAMATLVQTGAPHGTICVAFTPDEEIGEGADHFDVASFGATVAYTLDGGSPKEIENENFNAAFAQITIHGAVFHPGGSYGCMVNSLKLAMEYDAMLPAGETPAGTRNREGFYHLIELSGHVGTTTMKYLIRDFDMDSFQNRKRTMQELADKMNQKYGAGTLDISIQDTYYNMKQYIDARPEVMDKALAAMKAAGVEPELHLIRGGTDGAHLAEKGLVCPNLGDGCHNAHGEREYASLTEMETVVSIVLKLAEEYAKTAAEA